MCRFSLSGHLVLLWTHPMDRQESSGSPSRCRRHCSDWSKPILSYSYELAPERLLLGRQPVPQTDGASPQAHCCCLLTHRSAVREPDSSAMAGQMEVKSSSARELL